MSFFAIVTYSILYIHAKLFHCNQLITLSRNSSRKLCNALVLPYLAEAQLYMPQNFQVVTVIPLISRYDHTCTRPHINLTTDSFKNYSEQCTVDMGYSLGQISKKMFDENIINSKRKII